MHFVGKLTGHVSIEVKCIIPVRVYPWCSWLSRNIKFILQSCPEKGHDLICALDLLRYFKMFCTLR